MINAINLTVDTFYNETWLGNPYTQSGVVPLVFGAGAKLVLPKVLSKIDSAVLHNSGSVDGKIVVQGNGVSMLVAGLGAVTEHTLKAGESVTLSSAGPTGAYVIVPMITDPASLSKKSELTWAGLTGRVIAADTSVNLIQFLESLPAPTSGTFAPFFNTVSDKLNAFNTQTKLTFKLSLVGAWAGGSSRSMQLDFLGTVGNRLVESRDVAVTGDNITLSTFFGITKNGNIVTNGTTVMLKSNGGSFTVTDILLIAEQSTSLVDIVPV